MVVYLVFHSNRLPRNPRGKGGLSYSLAFLLRSFHRRGYTLGRIPSGRRLFWCWIFSGSGYPLGGVLGL